MKARTISLPTWVYPLMVIAVILVLWEAATVLLNIPDYLLPRPSQVFVEMQREWQTLGSHALVTTEEILLGFAASILIGVLLAAITVYSRIVRLLLYPLLVASQVVPKVAIAPLFIIWLGFGTVPKVIIVFLIAFFPIVIDTVVGLESVEPEMLELARSMGAGQIDTFVKIRLPGALPNIFGGLKISITLAVVGAIVAEFVGSDRGLGYLLLLATGQLDASLVFASIFVLTGIGLLLFALIEVLERLVVRWRPGSYLEQSAHSTM